MKHYVKNLYSVQTSGFPEVPNFLGQRESFLCYHCHKQTVVAVPPTGTDWEMVANDYKRYAQKMQNRFGQIVADITKKLRDSRRRLPPSGKETMNEPVTTERTSGAAVLWSALVRVLREWRNPRLKCERLTHDWRQVPLRRYEYPSKGWRGVADDVSYTVQKCKRCGAKGTMTETGRETINSLSMPSEHWRQLKATGHF